MKILLPCAIGCGASAPLNTQVPFKSNSGVPAVSHWQFTVQTPYVF